MGKTRSVYHRRIAPRDFFAKNIYFDREKLMESIAPIIRSAEQHAANAVVLYLQPLSALWRWAREKASGSSSNIPVKAQGPRLHIGNEMFSLDQVISLRCAIVKPTGLWMRILDDTRYRVLLGMPNGDIELLNTADKREADDLYSKILEAVGASSAESNSNSSLQKLNREHGSLW